MMKTRADLSSFMDWAERLPAASALGAGLVLALAIGWIDYLTGPELSLSLLYLIPIGLVTWTRGARAGLLVSLLCAALSLWTSLASGAAISSPLVLGWNTVIHFATFLVVVLLISVLRSHLLSERKLARTDVLTGALNNRAFYQAAKIELDRARRYGHPFAVAYIDLDHFKDINASFGYSIGDAVLRTVSRTIETNIRTVDILARLGGDEFALLLPETGDQAAQAVLPRLHRIVTAELEKGEWPLTISMGATIFLAYPPHVDDIIHMADHAMYKVKRDSQNAIRFTIYDDPLE